MTTNAWRERLAATTSWLERRDAALRERSSPKPVGPELAALYLDFLDWCRDTGPVLDVGCGRGERRRHFPAGYQGIDAVDRAEPGFPFVKGLAEDLPWPDAHFDAVLSVEAFEHFADARLAADEALRVLRPGGRLLVFVCNGTPASAEEAAAHLRTFDRATLHDLFAAGLDRVRLAEDSTHLLLLGERRAGR